MFKKNSFEKSFTLLEVLIAITVITIGLVGAVSLITHSIASSAVLKGKLLAAEFAQEGIEAVRGIRDDNWLWRRNWLNGLIDPSQPSSSSYFIPVFPDRLDGPAQSWSLAQISSPDEISSTEVYFNENYKFFGQKQGGWSSDPAWKPKLIWRWIQLQYNSDNERLEVTSHVRWQERGGSHDFEVKDYLYDWQLEFGECPPAFVRAVNNSARPEGTSYYTGGVNPNTGEDIGDGPCAGTEMFLAEPSPLLPEVEPYPFRDPAQYAICESADSFNLSDPGFIQFTPYSKRDSTALCVTTLSEIEAEALKSVELRLVTDPY